MVLKSETRSVSAPIGLSCINIRTIELFLCPLGNNRTSKWRFVASQADPGDCPSQTTSPSCHRSHHLLQKDTVASQANRMDFPRTISFRWSWRPISATKSNAKSQPMGRAQRHSLDSMALSTDIGSMSSSRTIATYSPVLMRRIRHKKNFWVSSNPHK